MPKQGTSRVRRHSAPIKKKLEDVEQSKDVEKEEPSIAGTKKSLKHERLLQRVAESPIPTPYSKSSARRAKRRAKEQLVAGMDNIHEEISKIETNSKAPPSQPFVSKKHPPSLRKRQKTLQTEKVRHTLIMAHPSFAASPWETIATHAKNSLLAPTVASNSS